MWVYGHGTAPGSTGKNQDVVRVKTHGDTLVAALSDGAGSAMQGALGAAAIVQALMDFENPSPCCLDAMVQKAQIALQNLALSEPIASFAATMTLLVATPSQWGVAQVGDGFFVCASPLKLVTPFKIDEYVNETHFLTDQDPPVFYHVDTTPLDFWALSSDGLASVALDQKTGQPFDKFFNPFWNYIIDQPLANVSFEIQQFLTSKPLKSRVQDDVSLAIGGWI